MQELKKLRDEGLVRYLGFSIECQNEVMHELIACGEFDVMQIEYNFLFQHPYDPYFHCGSLYDAEAQNLGIVNMRTATSGIFQKWIRLVNPENTFDYNAALIQFVLSNPLVDVSLLGMRDVEIVEKNVATCNDLTGGSTSPRSTSAIRKPRKGRGRAMNRFTILTLGCFSRNRYWGEEDAKSYRRALCTSTLIETPQGARILVDPAVSGAALAQVLDERCGLRPEAVDYVYVTHRTGTTTWAWRTCPGPCGSRRRATPGRSAGPCRSTRSGSLTRGGDRDGNPGAPAAGAHPGPCRAALCERGRDGRRRRGQRDDAGLLQGPQGYYNSADFAASARSIDLLMEKADIVVPGHGNYF